MVDGAAVADWPGDPTREAIVSGQMWRNLGLTDAEWERIVQGLGRAPNWTELGIFSVAWSEHCAYKHSRRGLARLPVKGERLLVGPGENAGVLDIGGGWAVAVRLESHNHPSFVEPYQGAATGVGGIVRDVLATGARPVALLNSLRFGPLEHSAKNRYLFREVVAGIAGYGNAIGVPTVGGEVAFDPSYETNPLVNVMCIGFLRPHQIARAQARGAGNPVFLVGASTGRDGIHGAGLLASRTFAEDEGGAQRPRVQVGDPFMEKLLIEACLEALATGAVVGIQDLGAAGITAATSELAFRGGSGLAIDLDVVPRREPGMTPFEVMLSESQERMMLVVQQGREAEVEAIFARYRLPCTRIAAVTETGRLEVWMQGRLVADLPAALVADGAPRHPVPQPSPRPAGRVSPKPPVAPGAAVTPEPALGPAPGALVAGGGSGWVADRLEAVFASPEGGSREWIYSQFDHMVGLRTVLLPGHDAAVLRVLPDDGSEARPNGAPGATMRDEVLRAVAASVDGAEPLAHADPYAAAAESVLEGARNVAAVGATPLGITNGINMGNPERPEVAQQLADAIAGMADACRALHIVVTGGNVSLYNETGRRAIVPTVVVGMVGLLEGSRPVPSGFQRAGDVVVVVGRPALRRSHEPWQVDWDEEQRAIDWVAATGRAGMFRSCHDTSLAGLAQTLCEAAFVAAEGADGFYVELPAWPQARGSLEALLFGAGGSAWVVTVAPEDLERVESAARTAGVPLQVVGTVTPGRLRLVAAGWGLCLDRSTGLLRARWQEGLASFTRLEVTA